MAWTPFSLKEKGVYPTAGWGGPRPLGRSLGFFEKKPGPLGYAEESPPPRRGGGTPPSAESGTIYIGSATDLSIRLLPYYMPSQLKRIDNYICRAILRHGHSTFSLSIIEYIDISNLDQEKARNLILSREQVYLDLIFSIDKPNTYNILKVAGSPLGYKHLAETKAKMSSAHKGKVKSEETKARMSAAKGTTIYIYDAQGILVNSFCSGKETARYLECSYMTIYRYVDKNKLFKGKWILSSSEKNKKND